MRSISVIFGIILVLLFSIISPITFCKEISYITNVNVDGGVTNDNIRSPSEFEQATELMISWPRTFYFGQYEVPFFIDIIRASEKAVSVRINVNNLFYKFGLISKLNEKHISLDNITISVTPTNSYWIRDYGPFFIEKNEELSIVDFNYLGHRNRLLDDLYPTLYGIKNKIEFDFKANFALCIQGGNYMSNGKGLAMVADEPLEFANPSKTLGEMSEILKQYLGLNNVLILESQVDDGTGHIDMFCKLINNNTILVGQWEDTNDINYQILENNTQLLIDKGYNIIRVPMLRDPDEEKNTIWSYTNSLIINGTYKKIVLVPQYDTSEDSDAISIYKQAMPEYEIIGINSKSVIDYYGAIHCTTMTKPLLN